MILWEPMHPPDLVAAVILAYLIGSIPTSVVAGTAFRGIDIREHGSGNAGATNTFRVMGWKVGLPVALFDFAKGFVSVLLLPRLQLFAQAGSSVPAEVARILIAAAAVVGHVFPVYVRFRGGKGVATGAGVAFALFPLVASMCLGTFGVVLVSTGYVSLASIAAAAALTPAYLLTTAWAGRFADPWLLGFAIVTSAGVIALHIGNLRRLVRGTERRFDRIRLFTAAGRRRGSRGPGGAGDA